MTMRIRTHNTTIACSALLAACIALVGFPQRTLADGNLADYTAIPPLFSTQGSGDKPNILVVLDNSNSMDEAPTGSAVGSDNPGSKSEIARSAVKQLISDFQGKIRMGLMAYQQTNIIKQQLHNATYDSSYDPANYDALSTAPRNSLTKKYRILKTGSSTEYIYYNVALPFYAGSNQGTAYCYSSTASFDNGSETYPGGPWDNYRCFGNKSGTSDALPAWANGASEAAAGYSSGPFYNGVFFPTDSDLAQNILDFGRFMSWYHVGDTWFSNNSPGRGFLHTPIADLDAAQVSSLNAKLATSQFSTATDTPLRNAGLTPLEGTLLTAKDYFDGNLTSASEGGSNPAPLPPANTCANNDFVVLVTDGLPSTDKNGNAVSDTATAVAAVANSAASLLASGVRTYVVGFALPEGVNPTILDQVAVAGDTTSAYAANDAASLSATLSAIFRDIMERTSSSTAAAVVSNSADGTGAVYQALFAPRLTATNPNSGQTRTVDWVGTLHNIFIDDYGLFREDTNQNDKLDDYDTDYIVRFQFNAALNKTDVIRQTSTNPTVPTGLTDYDTVTLETMGTIWNARDELSRFTNLTVQRNFLQPANVTDAASGDRFVFTSINGSTIDFTDTAIDSTNFRFLDASSEAEADKIVDYVRGEEVTGFRSRTVDYDQDGTDEVWRLGDIMHSSPAVAGAPNSNYDVRYGDSSYAAFREYYKDRRQVVYVGGNDGMLHAFNAGFWNATTQAFETTRTGLPSFRLGEEMWAYVPENLLPHLQWLTDPNYPHVYYVDGDPLIFDARVFSDDSDHPGGWGTILVVGMRFGGGPFSIDTTGDSVKDRVMRSSYLVFDITNPETNPKGRLMAEITDPAIGFTVSRPTFVRSVQPGSDGDWQLSAVNTKWYLMFGSGPTSLSDATSTQTAKMYAFNLSTLAFESGFAPLDLGTANTFVGDLRGHDWDNDYIDDAVYFGVNGGTPANPSGSMRRLALNSGNPTNILSASTVNTLLASTRAIMEQPSLGTDSNGNDWVLFGTGRLFSVGDNASTVQETFYGIKEPVDMSGNHTWGSVASGSLQDTTGVQIFSDGSLKPSGYTVSGTAVGNYSSLKQELQNVPGWKYDLSYNGSVPSERSVVSSLLTQSILIFPTYTPNSNTCSPEGTSSLYAFDFTTGTPFPHGAFGFNSSITNGTATLANASVSLGQGLTTAATRFKGRNTGTDTGKVVYGTSTGTLDSVDVNLLPNISGRRSWRQLDDF